MLKQIYTIPNLLSVFRIILIPFYVGFYLKGEYWTAVTLLIISGISDLADGFIARHFNQVTDLGKLLDPLADKLTQISIVVCATIKNMILVYLLIIVMVKELIMITFNFVMFKKGGKPISAKWYGKFATAVFYVGMGVILLFSALGIVMPDYVLITIACLIALSAANSLIRYFLLFKNSYKENGNLISVNNSTQDNK